MQTVGHHAARRAAAAGADGDVLGFGIVDEVLHDEEVVDKAHLFDDAKLILQLLVHLGPLAIALAKALFAELSEIAAAVRLALRQLEARQVIVAEFKVEIALLGDLYRVVRGLLPVGEDRAHLLLALEIQLLALKAHAHRVVHGLSHLDAHEHILIIGVGLFQIMRVVRQHQRDARLAVEAVVGVGRHALLADAVVLDLEIKVLAEPFAQPERPLLRALIVVVDQLLLDLAGKTAGEADQPLGVLFEQRPVDAGLDVKAVGKGHRDKVAEIAVARLVFAQQYQVRIVVVAAVLAVGHVARSDIDLAADDGLDPLGAAGLVKGDGAVHHTVVGERDGALPQLLDALGQLVRAAGAVEQGIFAVDV